MSQTPFYIAFDTAHKPRGRISSNYKMLQTDLDKNGNQCFEFAEFPITRQNLAPCDLLVFACPDFSKISPQEIEAIKTWVNEDGGGLLLLSHAGGDKGRRSNLSELAEQFGMNFENDQVLDKAHNLSVENLPLISEYPIPHPITEGVTEMCFRAGCSLMSMSSSNISVVTSGPEAEPAQSPLIVAGEIGQGRVVCSGNYEMFRDKITGGYSYGSHPQIIQNIISWLKTSKREQMKAQGKAATPQAAMNSQMNGYSSAGSESMGENIPNISSPMPSGNGSTIFSSTSFQSQVKIISKEQLFKNFEEVIKGFYTLKEQFIQSFDIMKKNLENLMQAVIASDKDMIFTQSVPGSASMPNVAAPAESSDFSGGVSEITSMLQTRPPAPKLPPTPAAKVPATPSENYAAAKAMAPTAENLPSLTPMPYRPGGAVAPSGLTPPSMSQPPSSYSPAPVNNTPAPADLGWSDTSAMAPHHQQESVSNPADFSSSQPADDSASQSLESSTDSLNKSKEELQAEVNSMENKLNSVRDLRSFVDKKLETGKINQQNYDKQVKKLDSDMAKTKYRIDEIKALLAKK